jgi:hypothetical protein
MRLFTIFLISGLLAIALLGAGSVVFTDIAAEAGLTDIFYCGRDGSKDYILEILGTGVALFDYDRDGYLDAFFTTAGRIEGFPAGKEPSNQLYHGGKDGKFTRVTEAAGLKSTGWGQAACVGDYDHDGFDDLFVTYFGHNHLYRNTGKGTFEDVTAAAGLNVRERWSVGCAFLDYNLDGNLDLFVVNYLVFDKDRIPLRGQSADCNWRGRPVLCGPRGLPGETNQLFRNLGGGKFKEVSDEAGISAVKGRYSLSVTTLDYNEDGWPDIYVAVDSQASILFRNKGNGTFEDVAILAGVAFDENGREQAGMGSAAGDFDGDGHLDLAKTNFIEEASNLYRNNGDGSFDEAIHRYGLGKIVQYMGWGVGFLDFDNDSWPDLFLVNGHVYPELEGVMENNPYKQKRLLYRNINGKRFEDISASAGPAITARHSSRGLALGDYDNDGDVDVFITNENETPSLLRNDTTRMGGFLSVQLVGVKSNTDGIGARVTVIAGGRRMVQEVRSGSSFMSHNDMRLHFGLGSAKTVDKIEVRWPYPHLVDTVTNVEPNQFITITESSGITRKRNAKNH